MGSIELGRLLYARRKALKLLQRDVYLLSGVSQNYISDLEHGRVENPGEGYLMALAEVYKLPIEDMRVAQGWVVPSELNDGKVVYDSPWVRNLSVKEGKGDDYVHVLADWLGMRAPDQCFVLQAPDNDLIGQKIPQGFYVLFEKLVDVIPEEGEIVAICDERGCRMLRWDAHMTIRPYGRKLKVWES